MAGQEFGSMRNYRNIKAWSLADDFAQGRETFACLHGLIQAVEKEVGLL